MQMPKTRENNWDGCLGGAKEKYRIWSSHLGDIKTFYESRQPPCSLELISQIYQSFSSIFLSQQISEQYF
jgi:hypothetical protein